MESNIYFGTLMSLFLLLISFMSWLISVALFLFLRHDKEIVRLKLSLLLLHLPIVMLFVLLILCYSTDIFCKFISGNYVYSILAGSLALPSLYYIPDIVHSREQSKKYKVFLGSCFLSILSFAFGISLFFKFFAV